MSEPVGAGGSTPASESEIARLRTEVRLQACLIEFLMAQNTLLREEGYRLSARLLHRGDRPASAGAVAVEAMRD